MTGPTTAVSEFLALEKRSEKTYKARVHASERLARRGRAWNASMLAFSFALLVASIGLLAQDDLYGSQGELLLVALSVSSLIASLMVAQLNYAVRARDMETNYKAVQVVSQLAESAKTLNPAVARHTELLGMYHALIASGENHTTADKWRSEGRGLRHLVCWGDWFLTFVPYLSLVVPYYILRPVLSLTSDALL